MITGSYRVRASAAPRRTRSLRVERSSACANSAATPSRSPRSRRNAYSWISALISSMSLIPGRSQAYRHPGVAAHIARVHAFERALVDLVAGRTTEELLEADAHLEPRERGAEAHVDAVTEGEMMPRPGAIDVVDVGTIPDAFVAVGGSEQQQ